MNLTKNVLLSIINTGFSFSLITALNLHLNINIAVLYRLCYLDSLKIPIGF